MTAGTPGGFDFARFFGGQVQGVGITQDWRGRPTDRFELTMHGTFTPVSGTLDERLVHADGSVEQRRWDITRHGAQDWRARCDGIPGQARGGTQPWGFRWRYRISHALGGRQITLHCDDRMYAIDDRYLMNRISVRKFGVPVASLTLLYRRVQAPESSHGAL